MIGNYIKTALRNLKRYKFFTIINVVGFSIGLTTCIIIYLFIVHENSFEEHISQANKLHRIVTKSTTNKGIKYRSSVPYPLGEALRNELLQENSVVSVYFDTKQVKANDQLFIEKGLLYTDPVFCSLFEIDFIQGDASALDQPGTVILTEKMAEKYFKDENPIGKKLQIRTNLTVRGIIKNPPRKTHLPYQMLISDKSLTDGHINFEYDKWGSSTSHVSTYVLLDNLERKDHMEAQINKIYQHHYENPGGKLDEFFLLPLTKIHTDGRFRSYEGSYAISKKLIWTFASIGLIILIIALFNFVNLSIVQAMRRTKEVGLRKVIGATRKKLILQFLSETFLIVFVSVILALILAEMLLPVLNNQTGNLLSLSLYDSKNVVLFIITILIFVGLSAGVFPAVFMSKYKPIEAIRNKTRLSEKNTFSIYKILVILQFLIAQILVIGVITVNQQISFLKNKDLGFSKEKMLVFNIPHATPEKQITLKSRLTDLRNVEDVAFGIGEPLSSNNNVSNYQLIGDDGNYFANMKSADQSYLKTYDIKLKCGSWFRKIINNESIPEVVVNEKMTRDVGFHRADSAIGKYIRLFGKRRQIVGVVEDFHIYTLKSEISPVIFFYNTNMFAKAGIKLKSENYQETISEIEKLYKAVFPGKLFNFYIYEDYINRKYTSESKFLNLLTFFTVIAIILASMGLIGLVSFLMVQRTKDIGIRKALGSFSGGIVSLYTARYLKLILISGVFSWPIAYYILKTWLHNYAYHIQLSIGYFILGLMIIISISMAAILYYIVKVAKTNPVDSLRYE